MDFYSFTGVGRKIRFSSEIWFHAFSSDEYCGLGTSRDLGFCPRVDLLRTLGSKRP